MGKLGIIIYPSFKQNPAGSTDYHARLAQSVEHQTFNLRVAGSSPSSGGETFFFGIYLTMWNSIGTFLDKIKNGREIKTIFQISS